MAASQRAKIDKLAGLCRRALDDLLDGERQGIPKLWHQTFSGHAGNVIGGLGSSFWG